VVHGQSGNGSHEDLPNQVMDVTRTWPIRD
jgi:hypothetical protein